MCLIRHNFTVHCHNSPKQSCNSKSILKPVVSQTRTSHSPTRTCRPTFHIPKRCQKIVQLKTHQKQSIVTVFHTGAGLVQVAKCKSRNRFGQLLNLTSFLMQTTSTAFTIRLATLKALQNSVDTRKHAKTSSVVLIFHVGAESDCQMCVSHRICHFAKLPFTLCSRATFLPKRTRATCSP